MKQPGTALIILFICIVGHLQDPACSSTVGVKSKDLLTQSTSSLPFLLPTYKSSTACVEECLLFPPSSPSPGASKGGGPTQGV
ncbi:unnamed protein product [Pleuronectes platessa]|uniref:Uncharacterized protein n=1 Tax=Pleuronectes platessa TaxID=8262 RepID=A0A9N7TNR8_PLEPL|nr:unnamed protein product [Pleuronectes platessa]